MSYNYVLNLVPLRVRFLRTTYTTAVVPRYMPTIVGKASIRMYNVPGTRVLNLVQPTVRTCSNVAGPLRRSRSINRVTYIACDRGTHIHKQATICTKKTGIVMSRIQCVSL